MLKKIIVALRLSVSILPILGTTAQARVDSSLPFHAWEKTIREDTTEAYTRYILENPDSKHVEEATARIEMLDTAPVKVASIINHIDLPDIPDGMVFGSPGAERLMNI